MIRRMIFSLFPGFKIFFGPEVKMVKANPANQKAQLNGFLFEIGTNQFEAQREPPWRHISYHYTRPEGFGQGSLLKIVYGHVFRAPKSKKVLPNSRVAVLLSIAEERNIPPPLGGFWTFHKHRRRGLGRQGPISNWAVA